MANTDSDRNGNLMDYFGNGATHRLRRFEYYRYFFALAKEDEKLSKLNFYDPNKSSEYPSGKDPFSDRLFVGDKRLCFMNDLWLDFRIIDNLIGKNKNGKYIDNDNGKTNKIHVASYNIAREKFGFNVPEKYSARCIGYDGEYRSIKSDLKEILESQKLVVIEKKNDSDGTGPSVYDYLKGKGIAFGEFTKKAGAVGAGSSSEKERVFSCIDLFGLTKHLLNDTIECSILRHIKDRVRKLSEEIAGDYETTRSLSGNRKKGLDKEIEKVRAQAIRSIPVLLLLEYDKQLGSLELMCEQDILDSTGYTCGIPQNIQDVGNVLGAADSRKIEIKVSRDGRLVSERTLETKTPKMIMDYIKKYSVQYIEPYDDVSYEVGTRYGSQKYLSADEAGSATIEKIREKFTRIEVKVNIQSTKLFEYILHFGDDVRHYFSANPVSPSFYRSCKEFGRELFPLSVEESGTDRFSVGSKDRITDHLDTWMTSSEAEKLSFDLSVNSYDVMTMPAGQPIIKILVIGDGKADLTEYLGRLKGIMRGTQWFKNIPLGIKTAPVAVSKFDGFALETIAIGEENEPYGHLSIVYFDGSDMNDVRLIDEVIDADYVIFGGYADSYRIVAGIVEELDERVYVSSVRPRSKAACILLSDSKSADRGTETAIRECFESTDHVWNRWASGKAMIVDFCRDIGGTDCRINTDLFKTIIADSWGWRYEDNVDLKPPNIEVLVSDTDGCGPFVSMGHTDLKRLSSFLESIEKDYSADKDIDYELEFTLADTDDNTRSFCFSQMYKNKLSKLGETERYRLYCHWVPKIFTYEVSYSARTFHYYSRKECISTIYNEEKAIASAFDKKALVIRTHRPPSEPSNESLRNKWCMDFDASSIEYGRWIPYLEKDGGSNSCTEPRCNEMHKTRVVVEQFDKPIVKVMFMGVSDVGKTVYLRNAVDRLVEGASFGGVVLTAVGKEDIRKPSKTNRITTVSMDIGRDEKLARLHMTDTVGGYWVGRDYGDNRSDRKQLQNLVLRSDYIIFVQDLTRDLDEDSIRTINYIRNNCQNGETMPPILNLYTKADMLDADKVAKKIESLNESVSERLKDFRVVGFTVGSGVVYESGPNKSLNDECGFNLDPIKFIIAEQINKGRLQSIKNRLLPKSRKNAEKFNVEKNRYIDYSVNIGKDRRD